MKRKLEIVAQNTVKDMANMKLWQQYNRDPRNPYLSFEQWKDKLYGQ